MRLFFVPELAVLSVTVATALLAAGGMVMARALQTRSARSLLPELDAQTVVLVLVLQGLLIVLVVFGARLLSDWRWPQFGLGRPAGRPLLYGSLIGAVIPVGLFLWNVLGKGVQVECMVCDGALGEALPWTVASVGAMLPLNSLKEELLFRGYAFESLAARGPLYGCLASSLLFSLFHLIGEPPSPWSLSLRILIGCLFCLLRLRMRSLWAPMAAHTTVNLGAVLMSGNVKVGGLFNYGNAVVHGFDRPLEVLLVAVCALLCWRRGQRPG